jgi:hypothetical protein
MNGLGGLNLSLRTIVGSSLSPPFILTSLGNLDAGFENMMILCDCLRWNLGADMFQKLSQTFRNDNSVGFPSSQVFIHHIHLTDTMLAPIKAAIIQRPAAAQPIVVDMVCFHFFFFPAPFTIVSILICFELLCKMNC